MQAPISEVFSSFQGEGILVGRRQVFVRFMGCNLDCNYCDTPDSKETKRINLSSIDDLYEKINNLISPDLHSISFTGGEPLLQSDFIAEFLDEYPLLENKIRYPIMIETNGTLPNQIKRLSKKIDYVSLDIKLNEHFNNNNSFNKSDYNNNILNREIKSLNILTKNNINTYCKIAVLPSTSVDTIETLSYIIRDEIGNDYNIPLIIQPASPIDLWKDKKEKLFKFSEVAGKYLDVLIIPQVHKYLNIM